jgi:hypothetical protein
MKVAERQAKHWAEFRRQCEQEEQQRCHEVIAEFGGDPHAMADAILRYRYALKQLAEAINWARQGAPVVVVGPGPYWRVDDCQIAKTLEP